MPKGYHGKILLVDLNTGTLTIDERDEAFYRKYVGGSALGAYYLLKNTPAHADPLGAENTLVLSLSVITGSPVPGQSRMTATAKSPLTGAIGDSQSGGFFPAEMKFAGFDAIVITGKAEKPVYLWLNNGNAELRPAEHLWGKTTGDVEDLIKEELGDKRVQIAQCGPAGEKGVRFAGIITMANRANGRTGMGAVMGSKNLKAIAVRGKMRPEIADKKAAIALAKWGADHFPESDIYGMGLHGTAEVLRYQHKLGGLATKNWMSGVFDGWEAIDGETMTDTILKERDTCFACPVRCKRVVEITEGPYRVDPRFGGPEYETLATFGAYCGIDDLAAIAYANQICAQYGMDTISCGATIAWAMDAFEHEYIPIEDTGGIELRFGNAAAMVKMTEMIAKREGFGDVLAEGSARAAQKIGGGAEDLVVTVKKQELPAHTPHLKRSLGLIYAVNPFGPDHQSSEHDPSYGNYPKKMAELGLTNPQPGTVLNAEKVKYALYTEYLYSYLDTVNLCQFVFGPSWHLYSPHHIVEAVRAVTGWDVTMWEIMKAGERRLNMLRAFNAREGFTREDDKLPKKLSQAFVGGRTDGVAISEAEIEQAKDIYYAMAGWTNDGIPTPWKLAELGLDWITL